ncbi:hypothetical protein N5923_23225 [Erwiniaceae bacterium BAC15a-03b]|uniref:Uncharacterized protein n=1 Tax=Winslowiella arboricola TaxID=2978220 RepID=A0A9J6Q2C8_9GAMM|nr:hypothetical protein [Winslowiella arboricola]MCU5775139.1 hypothetical protein [Winslowiella arboricola]MCU5780407.1 hypothetical protein [Winslowiella arboricola]
MPLLRASTIEIFDMLSADGATGALSMDFAGTFGAQGAIATATTPLNTNIIEQDNMTLIFCWKIDRVTGTQHMGMGNLSPAAAPFTGFRLATAANNTPTMIVASGVTSPSNYSLSSVGYSQAWTVQTIQISNTLIKRISHAGAEVSAAVTTRAKSTLPIYLNGLPDAFDASLKTGAPGTIGMFCAYSEILATADCVTLMDAIAAIMADRGVTVP